MLYAQALENLATYHIAVRDYPQAEQLLLDALRIYQDYHDVSTVEKTKTLLNLAYTYRLTGQYKRALDYFAQAFSYLKRSQLERNPSYATWISRYLVTHVAEGNLREAEKLILMAKKNYINQIVTFFPHLTEKEKELFYRDIKWRFEAFNSFEILRYVQNPEIAGEMYDNQLISKAILLNETSKWKKRILASGDVLLITQFAEWQKKKETLGRYYQSGTSNSDLRALEREVEKLEKKLMQRSELFTFSQDRKSNHWKDVQKALRPGEAAIEIFRFRTFDFDLGNQFTDSVYYAALVITPATRKYPELVLIKNGTELESKFLNYYRNGILMKYLDSVSYYQFWEPLEQALVNQKKVYISNDGVFNQINLNTLYNPRTKRYILEDYQLQQVTNTRELIEKSEQEHYNNFVVLMGNPDFGYAGISISDPKSRFNDELVPLPATKKELELVNSIFREQGWKREIYMGKQATEDHLKSIHRPQVLHIATHGYFGGYNIDYGSINPLLNSGLYLAGVSKDSSQKQEDGILTAYEAMQLNLDNTELVILSACETGLGKIDNGEGVYGLQRAFKVAGAQNIIMSLWKVDDQTTQQLMTAFYKYWFKTQDKSQAFKQAQLKIKAISPHPYYWGAFVMVGE